MKVYILKYNKIQIFQKYLIIKFNYKIVSLSRKNKN